MKRTVAKLLTLLSLLTSGALAAAPNIVIILTDDQGYQDMGVYGSPNIKTPNLDRMADEGIRFTDFYVASSVCSASRAALLTGCYPERVGVSGALFPNWKKEGLDPKYVTIAEMLKADGYATAAVGKWHLGDEPEYLPINQGFDSYFGIPYSNDMFPAKGMAYAEDCLYREGITPESLSEAFPEEKEGMSRWERQPITLRNKVPLMRNAQCIEFPADQSTLTRRYTEEAVRFISQHTEAPFFLYLAHSMPHIPLYASPEFAGKSEAGLYGDCIEEIDWSVGEIMAALRRHGLDSNTLVFYSSDNGPWELKGSEEAKVKGNENRRVGGSASPFRGYKFSTWEGGMRVPTLMWWPGRIPSGQVSSQVASTIDMLPTLAVLSEAALPESRIDGKSLVPLLEGRKDAASPHDAFFYGTYGVRSGDWKAIQNRDTKAFELYNLADDISESRDLADAHPEVMARLMKRLEEHKKDL